VLSVERCRRHLPPGLDLSDTELEAIRDALYAVAEVAVDQFISKGNPAHAVEGEPPVTHPRSPESRDLNSEAIEVVFRSSSKEEPPDAG